MPKKDEEVKDAGLLDYVKADGKTKVQINEENAEYAESLGWKPAK